MIRLITFDVTNTLVRVRGTVGQLYSKIALEHGHKLDPKTLDLEFRKIYKIQYDKYPNFGVHDKMTTKDWWLELVCKTLVNAGCNDGKAVQDSANSLYQGFIRASNWELYPEVLLVLEQLIDRGYSLGIVSNFDERLHTILENLNVLKYFSFVLCSAEVEVAKPAPRIFQLALEKNGVSSNEALHVGDNFHLDYLASTAVGMSGYLVDRSGQLNADELGINPDHVIPNLKHLLKLH